MVVFAASFINCHAISMNMNQPAAQGKDNSIIPMENIDAKLGSVFSIEGAPFGFSKPGLYGLLWDAHYSGKSGKWTYKIAMIHTGIGGNAKKVEPCVEVEGEFLKDVLWRGAMGFQEFETLERTILDCFVKEADASNPIMKLGINNLEPYTG